MVWNLFSALGKKGFQEQFPKITEYCGADEIKRLALAQKVAGLFQDYEQYRPDLIKNWLDNGADLQDNDEAWQAYLYVAAGFGESFVPTEQFERQLGKNSKILESYKSLYIFGDVSFTPLQLQYLKALRVQPNFEIHIYRTNLDLRADKNPLAQNWGEFALLTKEQLQELAEIPAEEKKYESSKDRFKPHSAEYSAG